MISRENAGLRDENPVFVVTVLVFITARYRAISRHFELIHRRFRSLGAQGALRLQERTSASSFFLQSAGEILGNIFETPNRWGLCATSYRVDS